MLAARAGAVPVCIYLIEAAEADVWAEDKKNRTVLNHIAFRWTREHCYLRNYLVEVRSAQQSQVRSGPALTRPQRLLCDRGFSDSDMIWSCTCAGEAWAAAGRDKTND